MNSMLENEIKREILYALTNGVIAEFQIEEQLRLKAIPSFSVTRLTREIKEAYTKKLPRY